MQVDKTATQKIALVKSENFVSLKGWRDIGWYKTAVHKIDVASLPVGNTNECHMSWDGTNANKQETQENHPKRNSTTLESLFGWGMQAYQ